MSLNGILIANGLLLPQAPLTHGEVFAEIQRGRLGGEALRDRRLEVEGFGAVTERPVRTGHPVGHLMADVEHAGPGEQLHRPTLVAGDLRDAVIAVDAGTRHGPRADDGQGRRNCTTTPLSGNVTAVPGGSDSGPG